MFTGWGGTVVVPSTASNRRLSRSICILALLGHGECRDEQGGGSAVHHEIRERGVCSRLRPVESTVTSTVAGSGPGSGAELEPRTVRLTADGPGQRCFSRRLTATCWMLLVFCGAVNRDSFRRQRHRCDHVRRIDREIHRNPQSEAPAERTTSTALYFPSARSVGSTATPTRSGVLPW